MWRSTHVCSPNVAGLVIERPSGIKITLFHKNLKCFKILTISRAIKNTRVIFRMTLGILQAVVQPVHLIAKAVK
jgi:hypothetical protein